jgi:hypothetical protein
VTNKAISNQFTKKATRLRKIEQHQKNTKGKRLSPHEGFPILGPKEAEVVVF